MILHNNNISVLHALNFWGKLLSRLIVLLAILLSILSCGRNILEPESIPPPTDFYTPPDTIPGDIIVEPIPTPDGTVFGGFGKRFIYQGKWHVLVDNVYSYDPNTKILTPKSSKSLIRLNDEENIEILGENLDNVKPNGYSGSLSVWDLLKSDKLVIENNKTDYYGNNFNYGDEEESVGGLYYTVSLYVSHDLFSSKNLVDWDYKNKKQDLVYFPIPAIAGGTSGWQDDTLSECTARRYTYFKGYYYSFGCYTTWHPETMGDFCMRIKEEDALINGKDPGKWERIDHDVFSQIAYAFKISGDGDKLFLETHTYRTSTYWSTTDGKNWKKDTLKNYNNAVANNGWMSGDIIIPTSTPLEPNWAKSTKDYYYKIDNVNDHIPIHYAEIEAAAGRDETNFIVTEEHKNSYNNFLVSSVHPDSADKENWKALQINNYTKSSMHWVSSPEYLFAFGDKLIRFVDYDMIDNYYNSNASQKTYDDLIKNHKKWYERGNNGGDSSSSQRDCYEQSMIYKAMADVMSSVLHGDIKDVYPNEAVSHYLLEFNH